MMDTINDKQLEANRQNALKGGVKTDKGKEAIRFNARKHGILGNLVTEYENDFYTNYLDQLFDEFKPETVIENILVERIALHYLKLYRLTKAESEFIKSCLQPAKTMDCVLFGVIEKGFTPQLNEQNMQHLVDIYCRYEVACENRLYRAIRELKKCMQSRS